MDATTAAQVRQFEEQGFVAIPGALSTAEVSAMREALATDRAKHAGAWELRGMDHGGGLQQIGESGRWQSEPLPRTDAFDGCIAHPSVIGLLRHVRHATPRLGP
jgi:hypothetical protein